MLVQCIKGLSPVSQEQHEGAVHESVQIAQILVVALCQGVPSAIRLHLELW